MSDKHAYLRHTNGGMVYIYGDKNSTFEDKSPPIRTCGYEWVDEHRIEIIGVVRHDNESVWGPSDFRAICKAAHEAGIKEVGYRRYKDSSTNPVWVWFNAETARMKK